VVSCYKCFGGIYRYHDDGRTRLFRKAGDYLLDYSVVNPKITYANLHRRDNLTTHKEMFTSFKINLKPNLELRYDSFIRLFGEKMFSSSLDIIRFSLYASQHFVILTADERHVDK
jgi:hypothetical protein